MEALQENPTKRRRMTLDAKKAILKKMGTIMDDVIVTPPSCYFDNACDECGTHTDLGIEEVYAELEKSGALANEPAYTLKISLLQEEMEAFMLARSKFEDAIERFKAYCKDHSQLKSSKLEESSEPAESK